MKRLAITRSLALLIELCFTLGVSITLLGLASMIMIVTGYRSIFVNYSSHWEGIFWSFVLVIMGSTLLAWSLWTGKRKKRGLTISLKRVPRTTDCIGLMCYDLVERKATTQFFFLKNGIILGEASAASISPLISTLSAEIGETLRHITGLCVRGDTLSNMVATESEFLKWLKRLEGRGSSDL